MSLALLLLTSTSAPAQDVPASGTFGLDVVALTDGSGKSSLWLSYLLGNPTKLVDLPATPSRWLHRRRHMAASEAPILKDLSQGIVLFVPTGDSPNNGGLTVVDARQALHVTHVKLKGPAIYDPIVVPSRSYVISACDGDKDSTVLEAVWYPTPGKDARAVGSLILSGAPAGGVTRMHTDGAHVIVATTKGVYIVALGSLSKPMTISAFVNTGLRSPVTNVAAFTRVSQAHFAVMASDFGVNDRPADAVVVSFDIAGNALSTPVGNVPNTSPPKPYIPAAGCHEPGIVERGGIAFVAFLLREREPGTFFTKPAGVAVVGFGMPKGPTFAVVRTSAAAGEPFGELSVHGTRMAFMTSGSPRFWPKPKGGSERLNILYTPLDLLGSGTVGGVVGSAGPLGGRIGVEVTDRPLWSLDGRSLFVTTVNYPGAPNPGKSGSEILGVPDSRVINEVQNPMVTVVEMRDQTTERAYGLPTVFRPADLPAASFGDFTLFGQMTQTAAHGVMVPHKLSGYLGSATATARKLPRDTNIPPFPGIPPRTFGDLNGSLVKPPATYGARRPNFNLVQRSTSALNVYLIQASGDELLYQATGLNTVGFGTLIPILTRKLPAGSITASEILSF